MNEYQEKLERVAKAAKVIFDVTTVAGIRTKQIHCPHGNIPSYPTHAWWCDKCFWELEEALQDVEAFQQSFAADSNPAEHTISAMDMDDIRNIATPLTQTVGRKPEGVSQWRKK